MATTSLWSNPLPNPLIWDGRQVNKFAKSATDVYVRKNFTIIGTTNKRPTTDAENGFFGARNSKTQGVDQDAAARSIAFIDFKGRPKDEVMNWDHVPRGEKDGTDG